MINRLGCLRARCRDFHLMTAQSSERCDPAEARRRDRSRSGGQIAQPYRGIKASHLADEASGWPGVDSVAVGNCEHGHEIRLLVCDRPGRRCGIRTAQLSVFAQECAVGFGSDFLPAGSTSGRDSRDNQSFDEWCRRQNNPLTHLWVIDEIDGQFRAENRAAEVHQHDDTRRAVNVLDRLFDADGVSAEGHLVQACGHRDRDRTAVQHLGCQRDGGSGQCVAVRDDDEADEVSGRIAFSCCHQHPFAILGAQLPGDVRRTTAMLEWPRP